MAKTEFQINEHIALKLEKSQTNIYVGGELFRQCKYLLLLPQLNEELLEINSIDEAGEILDSKLEQELTPKDLGITAEEEFWAHCSNLQVWVEYNYDSRILHKNLAFPLLKKLTELGNYKAKRVFKEEIARRLESGELTTINYLIKEKYLSYFKPQEIEGLDIYKKIQEELPEKLDLKKERVLIETLYYLDDYIDAKNELKKRVKDFIVNHPARELYYITQYMYKKYNSEDIIILLFEVKSDLSKKFLNSVVVNSFKIKQFKHILHTFLKLNDKSTRLLLFSLIRYYFTNNKEKPKYPNKMYEFKNDFASILEEFEKDISMYSDTKNCQLRFKAYYLSCIQKKENKKEKYKKLLTPKEKSFLNEIVKLIHPRSKHDKMINIQETS